MFPSETGDVDVPGSNWARVVQVPDHFKVTCGHVITNSIEFSPISLRQQHLFEKNRREDFVSPGRGFVTF